MASNAVKAMPPSERVYAPSTPIAVPLIPQTTRLNGNLLPAMNPSESNSYSDDFGNDSYPKYPNSNQAAEIVDQHY